MEPPICAITDEPFDPADGRRVRFVVTPEGRRFAARVAGTGAEGGIAGDSPDEAWFGAAFAAAAETLAATHTCAEAIAELRRAHEAAPNASPEARAAHAAYLRRHATRVEHDVDPPLPHAAVRAAFRDTLDTILLHLELADVEPEQRRQRSRGSSPEPRDAVGLTTNRVSDSWTNDHHTVELDDEITHWDSWSGMPGEGDLFQGTLTLGVDDTRLHASFGSDGLVSRYVETGERTSSVAALLAELISRPSPS